MTHLSNSQLSTWVGCAKKYELTRLRGAQEDPSVWLVGGSAVHDALETVNRNWVLKEIPENLPELWNESWAKQLAEAQAKTDLPVEKWRTAGKPTKEKPNGEDLGWWHAAGLEMIDKYVAWLKSTGWKIAVIDDVPVIELGLELELEQLTVKGFVDCGFVTEDDTLVCIADGVYASLVRRQLQHGARDVDADDANVDDKLE